MVSVFGPYIVPLACLTFISLTLYSTSTIIIDRLTEGTVETNYGKYHGYVVNISSEYRTFRPVSAYLGIRYASLLKGDLRFMPPTHPKRLAETIIAHKHVAACPQYLRPEVELRSMLSDDEVARILAVRPFVRIQGEDCLSLNVYTPHTGSKRKQKLAVLVFIHGDSYLTGTGNAYDGSVLSSYGQIIVITINYRLGVLGFLSTGESKAPGNYALLDIMAALHWVRENVAAFGGDPDAITVMGHGTGAALVHILLISPVSAGGNLFKRVILLSGTALSQWAVVDDPVSCTKQLARKLDCLPAKYDSAYIISCLHNKTVSSLVAAYPIPPKYATCLGPVVSPWSGILPIPVVELHKSRNSAFRQTDMLLGVTKHEAYKYLTESELKQDISNERRQQIVRTFVHNNFRHHRQHIYDILYHQYTDWDNTEKRRSKRDSVLELLSDGLYVTPLLQLADRHSLHTPTFLYAFTYSTHTELLPHWTGSVRGDELAFIFGAPLVKGVSPFSSGYTRPERNISETVMTYFTNFIKTGNPNNSGDRSKHAKLLNWTAYDISKQAYLHFGKRPKVAYHYRAKKISVWLKLLPKISMKGNTDSPADDFLTSAYNLSTFDEPNRLVNLAALLQLTPPTTTVTQEKKSHTGSGLESGSLVNTKQVTSPSVTPQTNTDSSGHGHGSRAIDAIIDNSNKITLSITIAVGCTLLLLNFIAFIGIYYQKRNVSKVYKSKSNDVMMKSNMRPISDHEPRTHFDAANSELLESKMTNNYREHTVLTHDYDLQNSLDPPVLSTANHVKTMPRGRDEQHSINRNAGDAKTLPRDYETEKRTCPHDDMKLCYKHREMRLHNESEQSLDKRCPAHSKNVITRLSHNQGQTSPDVEITRPNYSDNIINYVTTSPSITRRTTAPSFTNAPSNYSGTVPDYSTITSNYSGSIPINSTTSAIPTYTCAIPNHNAPNINCRTFKPVQGSRHTDFR